MNRMHSDKVILWSRSAFPVLAIVFGMLACGQDKVEKTPDPGIFRKEAVSVRDLGGWDFRGLGKAFDAGNGQFCLMENDSTFGVVLISPDSYPGDLIIRYKTMALTSSTVLVAIHSASDPEAGGELNIPEGYNGNMGLWIDEKDNYFCAFRNAPHNHTPFIRKYPRPGENALGSASENFMLPGKYYSIEIGKSGNSLWLGVDGKNVVETVDPEMLSGGHIAFRIRGTAGLKAACLVKDLEIYTIK